MSCPFLLQILVKLCTFVSPSEELAQKDDLQLLFSAITSWCPPHNLPWRRSAGEVLTTISRHGLSVNVVKYIHGMYKCTTYVGHLCTCVGLLVMHTRFRCGQDLIVYVVIILLKKHVLIIPTTSGVYLMYI